MSRQHKVTNASVNNLTTTDFHVVRGAAQAHTVMSVCVSVSLNPLHYGKQRQMGRQSEPEGEKKHRQCSCFLLISSSANRKWEYLCLICNSPTGNNSVSVHHD